MKNFKFPKWLKTALPVVLGVLVVTGVIAYSANPAMFQGALSLRPTMTKIDTPTLRPAPVDTIKTPIVVKPIEKTPILEVGRPVIEVKDPVMPVIPIRPLPENPTPLPMPVPDTTEPTYPAPSDTCIQLKEWQASGLLTANIINNMGGDWSQWKKCQDNYSQYMNTWPSVFVCETYKSYLDAGTLSDMVANNQIAVADYLYCATQYKYMWHDKTPPENYCAQLRVYQEQGVLDQYIQDGMVPAYDKQACMSGYSYMWTATSPGELECRYYAEWFLQGMLTDYLNGNTSRAFQCAKLYPDQMWENRPDLAICKDMKQQEKAGTLGQVLGDGTYSFLQYLACQMYYPTMWQEANPSENYCHILKGYFDQGILTPQMLGDTTEAKYCADNYPNIWYGTTPEPEPQVACKGFVDVPKTHKYYDAVQYMVQAGLADANPYECKFRPDDNVNRAEASKLMVMGFALPLISHAAQVFPDVAPEVWFFDYVSTVYKAGIMTGYPDGTFKPANSVVRSEMFKMFLEAYRGKQTSPAVTLEKAKKACPDVMAEEVGRWYLPYVVEAKDTGLMPKNDSCRSADLATRAEFAAMFYYVSQL